MKVVGLFQVRQDELLKVIQSIQNPLLSWFLDYRICSEVYFLFAIVFSESQKLKAIWNLRNGSSSGVTFSVTGTFQCRPFTLLLSTRWSHVSMHLPL